MLEVVSSAAIDLLEWRDSQAPPETRAGKMLRLSELRAVYAAAQRAQQAPEETE